MAWVTRSAAIVCEVYHMNTAQVFRGTVWGPAHGVFVSLGVGCQSWQMAFSELGPLELMRSGSLAVGGQDCATGNISSQGPHIFYCVCERLRQWL